VIREKLIDELKVAAMLNMGNPRPMTHSMADAAIKVFEEWLREGTAQVSKHPDGCDCERCLMAWAGRQFAALLEAKTKQDARP